MDNKCIQCGHKDIMAFAPPHLCGPCHFQARQEEKERERMGTEADMTVDEALAEINDGYEMLRDEFVAAVEQASGGKGNAGKPEMMDAVRREWPGWDGDDNEADARWIAVCAGEAA